MNKSSKRLKKCIATHRHMVSTPFVGDGFDTLRHRNSTQNNMSSLLSLMTEISRNQAAQIRNEQELASIQNKIVKLTEQADAARDALREAEAALADAPSEWQSRLTEEEIDHAAKIDSELASEGRRFLNRNNSQE